MTSSGLEQLLSLRADLNKLIDTYAESEPNQPFRALDDVGGEVLLEPLDPQLAKITSTLSQMTALTLGDKLPFHRAFDVSDHLLPCRCFLSHDRPLSLNSST
jgi:hypothetical protein